MKKNYIVSSIEEHMSHLKPIETVGLEGERLNVRRNINIEIFYSDDVAWRQELSQRNMRI